MSLRMRAILIPFTLLLALKSGGQQGQDKLQSVHSFTGTVKATNGRPVPKATVLIYLDQLPAQAQHVDSNGNFSVNVPNTVRSMRLNVTADGFEPLERETSPVRTGPEILTLSRAKAPQAPSSPLKASPPQQVVRGEQTCSGVNCNFAPNFGDQSVHYGEPKPLPAAWSRINVVPEPDKTGTTPPQGGSSEKPGTYLSFGTYSFAANPTFLLDSDVAFEVGMILKTRASGEMSFSQNASLIQHLSTTDLRHHKITMGDPSGADQSFYVRLIPLEAGELTVRVTTVEP